MRQKVLITGASGFLGYHLIKSAIENGLEVYAAVRKNSDIKHLEGLPVHYLFLNYEDEDAITEQLTAHHIDFIVHAAGVTKAIRQDIYNQINAGYTLNLARAAEKLGSQLKKMVFISSLAAIGPLQEQHYQLREDTLPNPVTAYGRSKLLAEKGLVDIDLPVIILRPTAVYGPRDKDIFILLKTLNSGLDPYIGNFIQQLSFVHARDVADVAVKSLIIKEAIGTYNITDGNCYNRYDLSDITRKILKKKAFRFHLPMAMVRSLAFVMETTNGWLKKPSVLSREKLHEIAAKNWICDVSKAKRELGFAPKFDLQKGLEDSIAWYTKNHWLK